VTDAGRPLPDTGTDVKKELWFDLLVATSIWIVSYLATLRMIGGGTCWD